MEKYPLTTAEDFIQDSLFQEWVLDCTPQSAEFWEDFQLHHPERKPTVTAARALLLALHHSQSLPTAAQGQRLWARISEDIEASPEAGNSRIPTPVMPLWKWLSAAAMLVAALGLGWFVQQNEKEAETTYTEQIAESAQPLIEKVNSTGKPLKLALSDGSRVLLYPASRISYADPFVGDKREVFLSGKGYFEVVKDDTKPFVVFAHQLVTQVVGTSFLIDAFENNASPSVEVRSGKVKVFRLDQYRESQRGKAEKMVLLTANQQVSYDKIKKDFFTRYIARPALLKTPAAHPDFRFENSAVEDVFGTLQEAYGVTIDYDQERLKNCRITVPLGTEPFFRKLDIICQTIGATYEVWGTRIVVSGKGCDF